MNSTNIEIAFAGELNTQDSFALNELRESLEESKISVETENDQKKTGVKDGGLTLALTIAGLALSAVGTLVSAISLWGSKKNYSITFKTGDATFAANNLSAKETLTIAQAIKDKAVASDIRVLVSHR
jgi:hypothetical protein